MRFVFWTLFFSLPLLVAGPFLTPAATAGQPPPVRIEADRMESGAAPNSILFSGQVVARQDELTVHAATMTIFHFSSEEQAALPPGDQRRLKKLEAEGEVRIETEEWIGTGDFMEYFELERKVYLAGNARAWQDNNLVSGATITLYLDEGRSIVERGDHADERVRAFFYSGNNTPPLNGDDPPRAPDLHEAPAEDQPAALPEVSWPLPLMPPEETP